MAYLTWLADVLRAGGCRVWEDPHWRTRGHGGMDDIRGVLCHHTAGGGSNDWRIVRDGRAGLSGPLAQLCLERDGTYRVLAAGRSWHAGTGYVAWCGRNNGNNHLIGIEGVSTGRWGDWTPAQMEAYARGVTALLRHLRLPASRALAHKEWAPNRKIDPSFDMHPFRADVARLMAPQAAPGGIETMAFGDSYTDWAGNRQTVQSWMDLQDKRSWQGMGRHDHIVTRINQTANAILARWEMEDERHAAMVARLDEIEAKLDAHAGGEEVPKA